MSQPNNPVRLWLDEADAAMAGDSETRRDVLLELETAIYDRVDERTRGGAEQDEAIEVVLRDMGNPVEVGNTFMPERPLLAAHHTRPFLINTGVVFAVHFLLVIAATIAGQALGPGFVHVDPIADTSHVGHFFVRAATTLVFDAGLVLLILALMPRFARILRIPRLALTVHPDSRRCVQGAFFLALVLVVLNFFRSDLLALYVPGDEGTIQVPLVGPGIVQNLLFLNIWLAVALVRDLLYARWGETRLSLVVDVASCAIGLYCLLRIVATKTLVDLAPAHEALGPAADGIGAILNQVFCLIALSCAALLGARVVRRGVRLVLLQQ